MKLDRALQKRMLEELAEHHPNMVDVQQRLEPADAVTSNLAYLEGHGLVKCEYASFVSEPAQAICASITSDGLDFIADDGGLGAVLKTLTIKLHQDTVQSLIEARIDQLDLDAQEKSSLKSRLKQLPAEGLSALTESLVGLAVEHLPDAIQLLRRSLGF